MPPPDVCDSVVTQVKKVQRGEISGKDLAKTYLQRVAELDPKMNAYSYVCEESALADDDAEGPLSGLSLAVCDRMDVAGMPTGMGTSLLGKDQASADGMIPSMLRQAGARLIGKTNCAEFALGSDPYCSEGKKCSNPWDLSRSPGGCDGGAGAAVMSGMCSAAVTGDAMGAGRVAAAWCGAVAWKPTQCFLRWPDSIPVPMSKKLLYQPCPIARHAEGMELLAASLCSDGDFEAKPLCDDLSGTRIRLICSVAGESSDQEVDSCLRSAAECLAGLGAEISEAPLDAIGPDLFDHVATLLAADAYTPIARLLKESESHVAELCTDVRSWLMRGAAASAIEYSLALTYQQWIQSYLNQQLEKCDFLLTPATPRAAPRIERDLLDSERPCQSIMYDWAFLMPFNMGGQPALVMPSGKCQSKVPTAMQLVAAKGRDADLISLAQRIEHEARFTPEIPEL